MKIIIVGDGKVGYALSEHLSREGHDITIIDNKPQALKKSIEAHDVFTIKGNGASLDVQKKAGTADADLLIAATSTDEINIICCLLARKLGAKHTIARIRNPEYNEQLRLMKDELGLNMVVNPELAAATDIYRLISFPFAINIGTFSDGKVSLIEYKVPPNSSLVGKTILKTQEKFSYNILICAVNRNSEIFIPKGDFVIESGDHIHIAGENKCITNFIRSTGQLDKKIRTVMIVGGGLITYYLSKMLMDHDFEVKIIEINESKCEKFCEDIPGALLICGDGTEKELLDAEGMASADAFVALTDMDEENLIMSMYARYKGVPQVITKINRLGYTEVIKNAGVDRVISPKNITANHIVRFVRSMEKLKGSHIKTLYRIMDEKAEVVEFVATESTQNLKIPIAKLPLKDNLLIIAIVRNGKLIIPKGKDQIFEGDTVVVVTTMKKLEDLNEIFID